MSEKNKKTESSNLKSSNEVTILIAALENSAKIQTDLNQATNNRIDKLDGHMIKLVDKIGTMVETQIKRDAYDKADKERSDRFEKTLLDVVEKIYFVEKQVLLLKSDYDHSKDTKKTKEKNSDARNNNIISTLAVLAILGFFAAVYPYVFNKHTPHTETPVKVEANK